MPTDCAPPTTWQLSMMLPETWQPGHRLELLIAPGWHRGTGRVCGYVEGRTSSGDEVSPSAALLSSPECFPVSEPPAEALSLAGLVAVAAVCQLRGRRRRERIAPRVQQLEADS